MRQKFICGNWKMNGTLEETRTLLQGLINQWNDAYNEVEVAVCPPHTSLVTAKELLALVPVQLGAQNCHYEVKGAFTGEVSPIMLAELGCSHVILGHSERRTYFKETDQIISKKVRAAIAAGLRPILCIGETLEERELDKMEEILKKQLRGSLEEIGVEEIKKVTIAYEPVWAIGTGKTATPEQAQAAHEFVREEIRLMYGNETSFDVIIQYGGSMNEKNALELLSQPDIDGGLIGGASLKADAFLQIVGAAHKAMHAKHSV